MPKAKANALWMLLFGAHAAVAQHVVGARAGTVHFTVGDVSVDGLPVAATALKFPVLSDGQLLRTGVGRVEVLLAPGVFLRLDQHGALRMADTRLDNVQLHLLEGPALVEVVEVTKGGRIEIEIGPTRTEFKGMGLFRFRADPGELRVFGGRARCC